MSFVLRVDLTDFSQENVLKAILILILVVGIFIVVGTVLINLWEQITRILFLISIFSYIFITASFSLYYCYEYGEKIDDSIYKMPSFISFFIRWAIFVGGTIGAVFLLLYLPSLARGEFGLVPKEIVNPDLVFMIITIRLIIIYCIIGIAIFAALYVIFKARLNGWLGFFFIFASLYASFLMINALLTLDSGNGLPNLITKIALFIFDLFILLISISSLIGKKADMLSKKTKILKSDTILVWLIFSKAAYEFSDFLLRSEEVRYWKSVSIFYLFIPILIIIGVWGIFKYGKLKKKRKARKKRKKRRKKK
ncbi:MAG: hypothetical protein GF353_23450 [Candidatus Lokiarchaeota archaeon]|nr:hypothetical protein [Candidatus Lokiarchaeota archaeon]